MPVCTSAGLDGYVAGEQHMATWARATSPGEGTGVLLLPSSTARAYAMFAAGEPRNAMYALAEAGFVGLAGDMGQPAGQTTAGNATAVTRIGQMKTYLQGSFKVTATAGKVGLLGTSGGGIAALNFARANPTLVSCVALISVPSDLERAHTENYAGFAALIETAWGGLAAFNAAMPAGNPHGTGNQAALADIPIKAWNSTNDPYNSEDMNDDLVALVTGAGGTMTTESLGAVGHSLGNLDPDSVADFFLANT